LQGAVVKGVKGVKGVIKNSLNFSDYFKKNENNA